MHRDLSQPGLKKVLLGCVRRQREGLPVGGCRFLQSARAPKQVSPRGVEEVVRIERSDHQPCAWIVGYAPRRPRLERRGDGVLAGVLGQIEVPHLVPITFSASGVPCPGIVDSFA